MRGSLDTIAHLLTNGQQNALELQWAALRYPHTAAIRTVLMEQYAPATANKALAALRRVLKEAWRLGQMSAEDYQRAADLANIKNETLPAGRALDRSEIDAIKQICDGDTPTDLRDAAIVGCLRSGLRRSEIVNLDLADYDAGCLRVTGKGRKERTVYLPEWATAAVDRWIEQRGSQEGPLLLPISKSGRILQKRLSDEAVRYLLKKRVQQAQTPECAPHDWRRTFAGDLLDDGVDLATVQRLMGHSDPATTSRYDRRGEVAKQQAVQSL